MLDQTMTTATADEAVQRMLLTRIDDAFRLATFILRDRQLAEDCVQEAALLAWRRRRSLRDSAAVDGWFTRILVNVCRDELRRQARRPRVVALNPAVDAGSGGPAGPGRPRSRDRPPERGRTGAARAAVRARAHRARDRGTARRSRGHRQVAAPHHAATPARGARRRAPPGRGNPMTDNDLEQRLRNHYRSLDPSTAPRGLALRIQDGMTRPVSRWAFLGRMPAIATGIAAVAVVALVIAFRPGGLLAPVGASPSPETPTPSASATPHPSPAISPEFDAEPDRRPAGRNDPTGEHRALGVAQPRAGFGESTAVVDRRLVGRIPGARRDDR